MCLEEKKHINNWRKNLSTKDAKYFSRLKFLVQKVLKESETRPLDVVLNEYDKLMETKNSVASMESYIKKSRNE
jgi:hypothetical protein